jgi:AraC-like DNA-binding protein
MPQPVSDVAIGRPPRARHLADVATGAGYCDQAHLNRDWRHLAGWSPTVWLAETLPPMQEPSSVSETG